MKSTKRLPPHTWEAYIFYCGKFYKHLVILLNKCSKKITEINFNSEIISEMARKFSKERFAEKIKEAAGQGLSYGL